MYIAPNSTVQYFKNVNLSPGYENSLYFATTAAKDAAFDALAAQILTETAVSYVYKDRPAFRSALPIAALYNVRYMRFKNTSFEGKWFYAFVTSVDYVNNGLTEISFELDEMLTWMGGFSIKPCLVLREHTATDNPYEHLVEEDLPTGDYVLAAREEVATNSDPQLVLSVARSSDTVGAVGHYKGNLLSGAEYRKYNISPTGQTDLETDIDDLITAYQKDAMISAQVVFGVMCPQQATQALETLPVLNNFTGTYKPDGHTIGGYTPKNKKLYNYPYCLMSVFNSEGSEQEFRYEFFDDHYAHFYLFGIAADAPEMAILPLHYKNSGISYVEDQMMIMKQWPQASIAVDQYKAWVAQMTSGGGWVSIAGKVGKAAASIAGGALVGGVAGGAVAAAGSAAGLAGEALNLLEQKIKYDAMPDSVQGTANSSIMMGINNKKFVIFHREITPEYARTIDDYFTAFGYRVNQVKVPSLANRPVFTYVQTFKSLVSGQLPAESARKIESILDGGCRFWRNIADIGDLTLNNAPT